ncbi:MAG TPA: VWA domain-containing protein [Vicinamibacterales bacterium]
MRALCAALIAAAVGTQQAPAPAFTPDTTVRIDISAVDAHGRFVDTLTAADFEVREDGAPQSIEAARLIRGGGRAAASATSSGTPENEQAEALQPGTRLFAIYLDEYHVSDGQATARVREALTRFVDRDLGPRDLLVVMKPLDSVLAIRLTHDREAAKSAIATFAGRKGDYEPRNDYEQNYMASTPAAVDQTRTQVTLSALNALAVHLGWVSTDARKTLIIVSEGVGHAGRRRGLNLPTLDSVVQSADRFNVSIYPIDPTGLPSEADSVQADGLRTLAAETDGQAVFTGGDLEPAFRRIAADSSVYYLLTYRSPRKIDGHFHVIQLLTKRRGVQLRSRKGYWAASPDDLLRAEWLAREALPKKPVVLEPARHISALIRPWFGSERGDAGKTRITFVWEPVRIPGDRGLHTAARVELTALGSDDAPVFQGTVLPTGGGLAEGTEVSRLRAVFDVPPGRVRLRMSIEDGGLQVIDSDVRDLAVRDLATAVVLGTPEVLRAHTALEFRALQSDRNAAPVASREFSRTERLIIRVSGYAPGSQRPAISARVMSRFGQPLRNLQVDGDIWPDGPSQIDLPLAGFAVGEYSLELTATSASGEAKDLIGFRITS